MGGSLAAPTVINKEDRRPVQVPDDTKAREILGITDGLEGGSMTGEGVRVFLTEESL